MAWIFIPTYRIALHFYGRFYTPQIYNVDAVAYESVMVGLISVLQCKPDDDARCPYKNFSTGHELNSVFAAWSRDGFHFARPPAPRTALYGMATEGKTAGVGSWNAGDVQSAGGGFLVVGDELFFYGSGRSPSMSVDSTGLWTLRRDGFASLGAAGSAGQGACVTTRPLEWDPAQRFLFANFNGTGLRAEVLPAGGSAAFPRYALGDATPFSGDATRTMLAWGGSNTTRIEGAAAGGPAQLRFCWNTGSLFSFWVSGSACGESGGFVAAGGPGLGGGMTDTRGGC